MSADDRPTVVVLATDDTPVSHVMAAITQALINYAVEIGADPVDILQTATNAARAMRDGSAAPRPVTINAFGVRGQG
jgi:adenine deaminase